jgi:hypothetical protein
MQGVTAAVFEDNFVDMPPGQKRTLAIIIPAGGHELVVRALNAQPVRLDMPAKAGP